MMETIYFTEKDFDYFSREFIGDKSLLDIKECNIEIDKNLTQVKLDHINIDGYLNVLKGTSLIIKHNLIAKDGVECGSGIKAGGDIITKLRGIFSGYDIIADGNIKSNNSINAYNDIIANNIISEFEINAGGTIISNKDIISGYHIIANENITAKNNIKSDYSIKSNHHIKAGEDIEALRSIISGLSISCKNLSAGLRIFSGIADWDIPTKENSTITCTNLKNGKVVFGTLKLIKSSEL